MKAGRRTNRIPARHIVYSNPDDNEETHWDITGKTIDVNHPSKIVKGDAKRPVLVSEVAEIDFRVKPAEPLTDTAENTSFIDFVWDVPTPEPLFKEEFDWTGFLM
jgi:hypothetical protein